MKQDHIIYFCKCNGFFIKAVICHGTYRIGRIRNNHKFRGFGCLLRNICKIRQEIIFCIERISLHLCPHELWSHAEHRVTWIWHQYHIPRITHNKGNMCHAFLRSIHAHDLICLKLHVKTIFIKILHSFQHFRPVSHGIFVIIRILAGLFHCFHNMLRCFKIRRTYRKIIDFSARLQQFFFLSI